MAQRATLPVGIIGGTGKLGLALAARLATAGHPVVLGSRVASRAEAAANELSERLAVREHAEVSGADNATAAAAGNVTIIAVPFASLDETVRPLAALTAKRVVLSTVVPIEFVRGAPPRTLAVPEGSAAEQVAALLPGARVVAALQTVSYRALRDLELPLDDDIVVVGDDEDAKREIAGLVEALGDLRAIDGGGLRNARLLEQLTVLLLSLNVIYGRDTGVRITNLDREVLTARGFGADRDAAAGG